MENIFIGFVLVSLDFNITVGKCIIGLLPDFIGYFFIFRGLRSLADKSAIMRNLIIPDLLITLLSFISYMLDLCTFTVRMPYLVSLAMGALTTVMFLYVSYQVVQGVLELERRMYRNLYGDPLYLRWQITAALSALTYLLSILPVIFLIVVVCNLVASVVFLAAFNSSKNAMLDEDAEDAK